MGFLVSKTRDSLEQKKKFQSVRTSNTLIPIPRYSTNPRRRRRVPSVFTKTIHSGPWLPFRENHQALSAGRCRLQTNDSQGSWSVRNRLPEMPGRMDEEEVGDKPFPGAYFVRRSPFYWGGVPKPLCSAPGRSESAISLVPRDPPTLNCLNTSKEFMRSEADQSCGAARPRIRRLRSGGFPID